MDISNLTSLINALRAETQEDSITPESLGALLQRIVDVLGDAASDFTVQQLVQWQRIEQQCTAVITSLAQGADDRNNLLLNVDVVNPSTGANLGRIITLKQATTDRAGIMRAQQVTDLNWCRNRLQEIIPLLDTLQESISNAASAANRAEQTALEGWQRMLNLEYDFQHLQNLVNTVTGNGNAVVPSHFISLEEVGGILYVRGDITALQSEGLMPYVFRYSVKQHRIRPRKIYDRRKGPKHKGWHLFYDGDKIKVDSSGEVQIKSHLENDTKGHYYNYPDFLFGSPQFHEDDNHTLVNVNFAFGKYTYNVLFRAQKFRFGIAYGLPVEEDGQFDMKLLRTNIADIKVRVYFDTSTWNTVFQWSR